MSVKKIVTVSVECDSCGTALDNERPVKLRVGTRFVSVDMCESCEQKAYAALAAMVGSAGWKESGAQASVSQGSVVRQWAVQQGLMPAGSRGRLSREVQLAYAAAHQH